MGNETVNAKLGKLLLNFSNTSFKPTASVLSPSESSVAAGSFVKHCANISESFGKEDDDSQKDNKIGSTEIKEQNDDLVNEDIDKKTGEKAIENLVDIQDIQSEKNKEFMVPEKESERKLLSSGDNLENNPIQQTKKDMGFEKSKDKNFERHKRETISLTPQDTKEILSAVTYSENEKNNLFDSSGSSSEEDEQVDEKKQFKKMEEPQDFSAMNDNTTDASHNNKGSTKEVTQVLDGLNFKNTPDLPAGEPKHKDHAGVENLRVKTLSTENISDDNLAPPTPTVHKESKARILNRVQVAAKSKKELKMQEKEINEKFQKESQLLMSHRENAKKNLSNASSIEKKNNDSNHIVKKDDLHKTAFDFQKFLTILKNKDAEPILKYSKSFLNGFSKRNWNVSEQIKLISDFKNFIYEKMSQNPPFSGMNEQEFINSQEGMEKLIMNRLYDQVFSPVIPRDKLSKSHLLDLKKDNRLNNQILRFNWINKKHLDLDFDDTFDLENFKKFATAELIKINNYRSPRDKIICVLNSCKVISGILKQSGMESNADYFIPLLIYVVLQTDEDLKLNSNISYIERFRMENALIGEVSYYLSSFWAVIGFIENLNQESLSILQEEWDSHMNAFANGEDVNYDEEEAALELEIRKEQQNNRSNTKLEESSSNANINPFSLLFQPLQSFFLQSNIAEIFDNSSDEDSQTKGLEIGTSKQHDSFGASSIKAAFGTSNVATKTEEEIQKRKDSNRRKQAVFLAQQAYEKDIETTTTNLSEMFPSLEKELIRDVVVTKNGNSSLAAEELIEMI